MKESCMRACAILFHHSWDKLVPAGFFLKMGPLCRICPRPSLPDQLSQWARSVLAIVKNGMAPLEVGPEFAPNF
jgi:hypothetical protein